MAKQHLFQRKISEYEYNQDIIHDLEQACLYNNMDDMCFNVVSPECEQQQEIDIIREQVKDDITQWGDLEDDAYRDMIRGFNEQQKQFMYHVLDKLKTDTEPLFIFHSGGAGVEKSVVTRA